MKQTLSKDEILNEWSKDSVIDKTELAVESLNIPILHEKYLRMLLDAKEHLRIMTKAQNILRRQLSLYYKGQLDKESLDRMGREPWQTVYRTKDELRSWIDQDDEFIDSVLQIGRIEDTIFALSDIMKTIHNRSFHIKNAIEYEKFATGG